MHRLGNAMHKPMSLGGVVIFFGTPPAVVAVETPELTRLGEETTTHGIILPLLRMEIPSRSSSMVNCTIKATIVSVFLATGL